MIHTTADYMVASSWYVELYTKKEETTNGSRGKRSHSQGGT